MKQADRKRATSEALVDSAIQEIFEAGIAGASVRRIADRAGFSQGAFYSNFETRNALLEAVLEKMMRGRLNRIEAIAAEGGSLEEVLDRLGDWLRSMEDDRVATLVMLECQLHALRDDEFGRAYDSARALQHDLIAKVLEDAAMRYGAEFKLSPKLMSLGLSALWSGFALLGDGKRRVSADELIGAFMRALI